ncbi:peroxisome proliferator-activated receptor gamma-like [Mytilus trossulus]|uniref:peroxisome proliferator-activated receptor gamma-like n=1 Tax=Mytilus trossulus TaxID=6551 RepID=UPI003003F9AC
MDYLDYSGFEPDSTTFYDQNNENYEIEPCDKIEGEPESTSTPALLPPCRICTRKASGFHYGVNTCEACKGFYRRTVQKLTRGLTLPYKCDQDQNCPIEKERNMCSYCRYQRCVDVGMSKQAIKQGRYTHARRAQYTKEIKGMPLADVKTEPADCIRVDEGQLNCLLNKLTEVQEKYIPGLRKRFPNPEVFHATHKEIYDSQCIFRVDTKLPCQLPKCLPCEKVDAMNEDEKNIISEIITSGLDSLIRFQVEFVKCIPGFKDLCLSDQSELLKATFCEFGYIGDTCMFNPDMKVMLGLINMPADKLQMHDLCEPEFIDSMMEYARKMQNLRLTFEEMTILRGIIVLSTDRCELQNPTKVEEIQWTLVQYLQFMTRHSKSRLWTLIGQLTALRSLRLEQVVGKLLNNFKQTSPFMNSFPVIKEVIASVDPNA